MCVHTSVRITFRCPVNGLPVEGTYDDATGRLDLQLNAPVASTTHERSDAIVWCIRTEAASYLCWADARDRLVKRGVDPAEL